MRFLISFISSYIILILLVWFILLATGDSNYNFLILFLFYASPAYFIFIPLSHFSIRWIRKKYNVIGFLAYLLAGFISGFICLMYISGGRFYTDWPAAITLIIISCVGHLIFYFCYLIRWKGSTN